MTTVTDDFNRSNEDLKDNSNWSSGSENVLEISSNQLQVKSGVTGNATKTVFDGSTFADDQQTSAKILTLLSSGDNYWGPVVRGATGGALVGYSAEILPNGDVEVYEAYYDLVVDVAAGLSANDKLTIRAEGTTITVYVNDVEKGSGTDSAISGGDPGFSAEVESGNDATPLFDDFAATDVLSNAYEITTASGTYTYSGTALNLKVGHVLGLASGTYTYSGTAAALDFASTNSYDLVAASGTYTYSGTALGLKVGRVLALDSGTYTYSGTAATLDFSANNILAAASGTYAYSGTAITFHRGLVLTAASGTYTYSGTTIDMASCSGYARTTIANLTLGSSFGSELTALGLNNGVSWDNAAAGSQSVHHVRLTGARITALIDAIAAHTP